jgi:hypothetical protein
MAVYFNGFPWVKDLNRLALVNRAPLPLSEPIHHIVKGFKTAIDLGQPAFITEQIAEKVHLLSKRKEIYYATVKYGFLIKMFSMLRNYLLFGSFESSADIGLKLAAPYLPPPRIEDPDLLEKEDEEVVLPQIDVPVPEGAKPEAQAANVIRTPKNMFFGMVDSVWVGKEIEGRDALGQIFEELALHVDFARFEKENEKTYHFTLKKDFEGKLLRHGITSTVIIKAEQTFIFSEENQEKFIDFPLKNVVLRMRMPLGFFSKDFYLRQIKFVDDVVYMSGEEGSGIKVKQWWPLQDCIDIWNGIKWKSSQE